MCRFLLKNGSLVLGQARRFERAFAPVRSARNKGSPSVAVNVDETSVVSRPGWSGVGPCQERSRRAAGQRNEDFGSPGIAGTIEPDLRPVAIEPEASQDVPGRHHRGDVEREIVELPGAQLTDPDVELPSRSATKATNLPSGEISACSSVPSQFVTRENVALASGFSPTLRRRRPSRFPHDRYRRRARRAPPTAATSQRARRSGRLGRRGRPRQHLVDRVDLDPDVADIPQALLRILRQTAEQEPSNRLRASQPAAPTSPARARGSSRSSPRPCRRQTRRARSTSRRARTRRPRCRCACRPAGRAPARDSCRRRCR